MLPRPSNDKKLAIETSWPEVNFEIQTTITQVNIFRFVGYIFKGWCKEDVTPVR